MLVKLYKMIKVSFHLIGMKNLLLWDNIVIRTSNFNIGNRHLAHYVKEKHLNESCMGSVIGFLNPTIISLICVVAVSIIISKSLITGWRKAFLFDSKVFKNYLSDSTEYIVLHFVNKLYGCSTAQPLLTDSKKDKI